jgi:hypothetical protein
MPKVLGDVAFVVYPDTTRFRPEADAGIKAALAGMRASIPLTVDDHQAVSTFTALTVKLTALSKTVGTIKFNADDSKLNAQMLALRAKIAAAADRLQHLPMDADTTKIDAKIASSMVKLRAFSQQLTQLAMNLDSKRFDAKIVDAQAKLKGLERQASTFQIDLDNKRAALKLLQLEDQADHLQALLEDEEADINTAEVQAKLDVVLAEIELINSEAKKIELVANYVSLLRAVAVARAEVAGLQAQARDIPLMNSAQIDKVIAQTTAELGLVTKLKQQAEDIRMGGIDPAQLARSAAEIAAIEAQTEKFSKAADDAGKKTGVWAYMMNRFGAANQGIGWTTAIGGIAGWHIVLDAALEATIIAVGSLAALGAAVAGVYPAVDNLAVHQKAALSVMTAYHVDAGKLAGSLDTLQKSLRYQVIEAYGGALNLMGHHITEVSRAAHSVVDMFDTWIAKIDIWANGSKSLNGILQAGTGYLAQLGKAVGILAQAIVNLLAKEPGVAHMLLDMLQGAAGLIDAFSKLPSWLVVATLGFHGLWVWGSVLLGVLSKMTAPLVSLVTWIAKQGAVSTETAAATDALAGAQTAEAAATERLTAATAEAALGLGGLAAAEKAVAEGALADAATQSADAVATEADAAANAAKETTILGRAFGGALGLLKGFGSLIANIAEKGLVALGGALRTAGAGLAAFGRGLLAILANPLTWFLLATAAIIGMAIEARKATPDVQKLIDTLNQQINSDQASQAMTDISNAIGQANAKINEINSGGGIQTFNQNWHSFGGTWQNISAEVTSTAGAFGKALKDVPESLRSWPDLTHTVMDFGHAFHDFFGHPGAPAEMATNIKHLNDQINNWLGADKNLFAVTGQLMYNQLGLKTGTMDYTQALTLMNLAGVRANDSLAVMDQKIANLVAGYQEMGAGGTQLQASINAVTFATEMQDSKVTALNQGWDSFFKLVSGGASDFLGFAKQVNGMNEAFSGATQGTVGLTIGNGRVRDSVKLAASAAQQGTASMTGLNDASIAAQETLLQTASAANTQMDSLTSLSAAAGLGQHGMDLLQQATKDMLSQMLPAAQGSQQMTDVLYALAQRGGYKGADSFQALSHWINTNSGSVKNAKPGLQDLQGIVTTMTTKAGNLADDVKNLSIALGQNLTQAMASAIVMASGGQKAMNDFATALIHGYTNSKQQQSAALALGQSLLLATGNVNDAKTQFLSFAQGALHLTSKEANQLWSEISGKLQPVLHNTATKTVPAAQKAFEQFAGKGGGTGLGLSTAQADQLWGHLGKNLGPIMDILTKDKGPAAQAAFEKFAGKGGASGLGLTTQQADALWKYLNGNMVPILGQLTNTHVPNTQKAFEQWAGKGGASGLGLTHDQADQLWHKLKDDLQPTIDNLHGKNVNVTMTGTGSFSISQVISGVAHAIGGAVVSLGKSLIPGLAEGGTLPGYGGGDRIPALLEAGETVLPKEATTDPMTRMVAAKYRVPGFAYPKGHAGLLGGFAGGVFGMAPSIHDAYPAYGYGMLRGYQAGGIVGRDAVTPGFPVSTQPTRFPYSGNLTPANITSMYDQYRQAFGQAFIADMRGALKSAEQAMASSGYGVLAYAESFAGKVPYVWGGDTPSGWDCSGFVSYVLEHFGLLSGRMVAAGLQSWAKSSPAIPGAMAFYGNPAHHVGFVVDQNTLLSALHHGTNTVYSSLNMGDNSGYGIPPQGFGGAGGGGGGGPGSAGYWVNVGREMASQYGWTGAEFDALNSLWTRESGWNPNARNPSSGAAGIVQDISGNFHGGGIGQIAWGLAYIASRYGDPISAWAHEVSAGWYDRGGVLPPGLTLALNTTGHDETIIPHEMTRFASGGVAGYHQKLAADQAAEQRDYQAFVTAAKYALTHALSGSYVRRHEKSIADEMGTLSRRQASETAAYKPVSSANLTTADISKFITAIDNMVTVTRDIALGHLPGGSLTTLRNLLLAMASAAAKEPTLPGTAPTIAGGGFPSSWKNSAGWPMPSGTIALADFWSQLKSEEDTEKTYYSHVTEGFRKSLAAAKVGAWDFIHRAVIGSELQTLALRQNEEISAYNLLLKNAGNQPAASSLSKFMTSLKSMAATTKDADLSHVPGGHPALMQGVFSELGNLYEIAGKRIGDPVTPFSMFTTPALPKPGTPAYITLASIYGWYDRGGILPPGLTLAWNGTGRGEIVSPVPAGGVIGPGGMTHGEMQIINRLDVLINAGKAAPAAYASALNGVAGIAANRGYYGSLG